MLLGILTTGSWCLFTIPCPLVCLVSAQLWQTVSYTTEGSVEFLLSVLEWAEGHSVTPKCNPKCVHMCVRGSEVSTLEGSSLLVWVTCQGVNVSASHSDGASLTCSCMYLWASPGAWSPVASPVQDMDTPTVFSIPCLSSQTPCTQVLSPGFSLEDTSQNFGLPSHRENSAKINKFMIANCFIIISSVRSEVIFLLLEMKKSTQPDFLHIFSVLGKLRYIR